MGYFKNILIENLRDSEVNNRSRNNGHGKYSLLVPVPKMRGAPRGSTGGRRGRQEAEGAGDLWAGACAVISCEGAGEAGRADLGSTGLNHFKQLAGGMGTVLGCMIPSGG